MEILTENKQQELIPPGMYCYVLDYTKDNIFGSDSTPVVYCPHSINKEINGINIPWCSFLDKGGVSNDNTDEEWKKLVEYFGSDDNVFDYLSLDLLWDSCKECGENSDHNITKEQIIEWINKVRK